MLLVALLAAKVSFGQASLPGSGSYSEDFNGIGSTSTATLPSNWRMTNVTGARNAAISWSSGLTATNQVGSASMSSTAGNGRYNFGNSTTTTDRAIGGLSSASASQSVNMMLHTQNSGGSSIASYTISYNAERYRNGSNAAGFSILLYYSTDGTTWTLAGSNFNAVFTANADNNGLPTVPAQTIGITSQTLTLPSALAAGGSMYFAWQYSVTSGTTTGSAQAIGIDDVSITATAAAGAASPSVTASPATALTPTGATLNGNVTAVGSPTSASNVKGFVYALTATNANPTIGGTGVTDVVNATGTLATGAFNNVLTGLTTGANYTFRAYAINDNGTSYSGNQTFTTIAPTVVAVSSWLNTFQATPTLPSDTSSIRVSGSNLAGNLTVTVDAGNLFELATSSTGPWNNTVSVIPVSGTVGQTRIWVRAKANPAGRFYGNLTVTSSSANSILINLKGNSTPTAGSAFNANNLLLVQVGDSSFVQSGRAAPVFLVEIPKAGGSPVQTIALPNTAGAGANRFAASGASTTSVSLNLSPDRRFATLAGNTGVINTPSATANSATFNKVVARVDFSGAANTSTLISDAYLGQDIRSAITTNGTKIWTNGNGGMRFVDFGNATIPANATTSILTGNHRYVNIANSQLWMSTGSTSGSVQGINRVGTGLPEAAATTTRVINGTSAGSGANSPIAFSFADRNATIPGNDVMYVADLTDGLSKFSFDGTNWTLRGRLTGAAQGVYAETVGSQVNVYFTAGNALYLVTDNGAQTDNIPGASTAITSLTPIYTATGSATLRGVALTPLNVTTPDVTLTTTSTGSTVAAGSLNGVLRMQLDVAGSSAVLSRFTITTGGNYVGSDIEEWELRYSADATLDAGDVVFATVPSASAPETLVFDAAQNIPVGTSYLFLTAKIDGCVALGRLINTQDFPLVNLEFFSANLAGTTAASNTFSVVAGTPSNVTNLAIQTGAQFLPVTWDNPTCFTDVLVVADVAPITATPNPATTYTANANYGTGGGSLIGTTGRVVYQGTGDNFTLNGLTVGQTYFVKVFVKYNGVYNAGVETSAQAQNTVYYSQASGRVTDAIWALTPTGTPQTATALGGFSSNVNVVVQSGHHVRMTASNLNLRTLTVNSGGIWSAQGTTANTPQYINLYSAITNNGSFAPADTSFIGINAEGANLTLNGNLTLARIRKNSTSAPSVATSNLTITGNVRMLFNGTTIFNNIINSRLNITVAAGAVVTNLGANSSVSMDGVDGAGSGDRGGAITVNGTLNAGQILYGFNNNTTASFTTPINIGATGTLSVDSAIIIQNSTAPALVTIAAGGKFQVRRHMQLVNGNLAAGLQLLSVGGRTARLAALGVGQTVGDIVFERAMPSTGWHFITAPVQGKTFADLGGANIRLTPRNNANLFGYTENDTTRLVVNGALTEVAGWKTVNATSDAINPANAITGYRLYTQTGQRLSVTGAPFVGTVSRSLTFTPAGGWNGGGWNLIANPYPSEIDWNAFRATNNAASLSSTVYIWNPALGQYATYNSTTQTALNGGGRFIYSGQAFFAKVTAAQSVSFLESHKTVASGANRGSFLRTGSEANRIYMTLTGNGATDNAMIGFRSDATLGYDNALDAYKLTGNGVNLSTVPATGLSLAANFMPELTATQVIPVRTSVTGTGTFTLSFRNIESLDAGLVVYLRDNFLGTLTDLSQRPVYTFAVTSNPATERGRFELVTGPASVTSVAAGVSSNLSVYPNPTAGAFYLTASGLKGSQAQVTVIAADGRMVYNSSFNVNSQGRAELPVQTQLAAGVYTVRMVSAGQTLTQKLVVE